MIHGIIDIGSNTIRLNVYRVNDTKFELLFSKKENAGIVSYIKKKQMSQEGIDKLERCLTRFKSILDALQITSFSAFATASLRNITNTQDVISQIYEHTQIPINLLSGSQEGQISFLGAIHNLEHKQGIYIDTGGASTEIILYKDQQIQYVNSLPVGSLNLYNKYVHQLIPTSSEMKQMQQKIIKELKYLDLSKNTVTCKYLAITGGSMRAIRSILVYLKKIPNDVFEFPSNLVFELVDELSKNPIDTMHLFLKVKPDRVHTLFCGLIIISTLAKYTKAQTIQVSCNGVREGYLIQKYIQGDVPYANNTK